MGNDFPISSGIRTGSYRRRLVKPVRLMSTVATILACIEVMVSMISKLFAYLKENLLPVTVKKVGPRGQPVWALVALMVVIKAWLYHLFSRWHYDRCGHHPLQVV